MIFQFSTLITGFLTRLSLSLSLSVYSLYTLHYHHLHRRCGQRLGSKPILAAPESCLQSTCAGACLSCAAGVQLPDEYIITCCFIPRGSARRGDIFRREGRFQVGRRWSSLCRQCDRRRVRWQ